MKILFSWLKEYVDYDGTPQEAARLLTEHAYEVEGIEETGKDDALLDIDVLANRATDSLSHMGVARELAAITESAFQPPAVLLTETDIPTTDRIAVEITDEEHCPQYSVRVVDDVAVGESPAWLRERLEALGQRSINVVVDVMNYVMWETGQPLHAFDVEKIKSTNKSPAKVLTVRSAKKGETMVTLDGEEIELDETMLVIADASGPVALAGIKGGKRAEVTEETTTIAIESAAFDPVTVRRATRFLGLHTDASRRFEAGLELVRPREALDRAAALVAEVAGGSVCEGVVVAGRESSSPTPVALSMGDIEHILGVAIQQEEVVAFLERLSFDVDVTNGTLHVTPPLFRTDIGRAEDVIEEVARLHGYNAIPSSVPRAHLVPPYHDRTYRTEQLVRDTAVGLGMVEVRPYSFWGADFAALLGEEPEQLVEIEHPMSRALQFLRRSLLPGLLEVVAHNAKKRSQFRLFEIGRVFAPGDDAPQEETRIAGVLVHTGDGDDTLFYEGKGALDSLLERNGIAEYHVDDQLEGSPWQEHWWVPGRSGIVHIHEQSLGVVGQIDATLLQALGAEGAVVGFELSLPRFVESMEEEREYTPFSRMPAVVRDVALLVPANTKVSMVLNVIEQSGAEWVTDVNLFDLYEGEGLEDNQKSMAFRIVYQAQDRTLTDEEVNAEQQTVERALKEEGWEVR